MFITYFSQKWSTQKASVIFSSILFVGMAQPLMAHGTITSPKSRIFTCYSENPENPVSNACKAMVASSGAQGLYDWMGVRQGAANDNHQSVVPNGQLCSGGDPATYGGLDLTRSDWVSETVSSGSYTFTWTNTAAHATLYYDYYITKNGYDPTLPLKWSDLELFCHTGLNTPAESSTSHTCTLPQRTGKQVVYSVWQRSDSPEAFYACVDFNFGGTTGNQPPIAKINGPYQVNLSQSIQFSSAGTTDPDGTITRYEWSFGDSSAPSTNANPSHTYTSAGTYNISLTATDNSGATHTANTTATVINTSGAGNLSLSAATYSVNEDAGSINFTINRNGGNQGEISVQVKTIANTATSDVDYTATNQLLTLANGQSSKLVTIEILDDSIYEGNEALTIKLTSNNGSVLTTPSTSTLTIIDNDEEPPPAEVPDSSSGGGSFSWLLGLSLILRRKFTR